MRVVVSLIFFFWVKYHMVLSMQMIVFATVLIYLYILLGFQDNWVLGAVEGYSLYDCAFLSNCNIFP